VDPLVPIPRVTTVLTFTAVDVAEPWKLVCLCDHSALFSRTANNVPYSVIKVFHLIPKRTSIHRTVSSLSSGGLLTQDSTSMVPFSARG
jgi:hypothetical protein